MGAVLYTEGMATSGAGTEEFETDAIGNRLWKRQVNMYPDQASSPDRDGERITEVELLTGRVKRTEALAGSPTTYDQKTTYDAGDVRWVRTWHGDPGKPQFLEMTNHYVGSDGKLQVLKKHRGYLTTSQEGGLVQEYRYDALGRRVLVRSRAVPNVCANPCQVNYIERTVWDDDQVLYEIRRPAGDSLTASNPNILDELSSGAVVIGNTHALGIDQPVNVFSKTGSVVYPHADFRGQFAVGSLSSASLTTSCGGGLTCPVIEWQGANSTIDGEVVRPPSAVTWFGNQVTGQWDASGLQYRRNRYYDPKTGRFTQQDPIGLAGGLNLYGYAGGDPVNFSDPFGTCSILSAAANVAMGAAISYATGSSYGAAAAAVDIASGCVGLGTVSKAVKLAKIIRANKRAGDTFEAVVGIASRGKKAIPSISGTAVRRVPDEMTELLLREAKSGSNIKLTNQIQDFLDYAKETGRQFILEVREGATIDTRLLDLEKAGQILIRRY